MILRMYSNAPPTTGHVSRLEQAAQRPVQVARDAEEAINFAAQSSVWLGQRYLRQAWPYRKTLKWLQITSGGLDPIFGLAGPRPDHVSRCTVHSDAIAHHALALAWRQWRRLDDTPPLWQGARAAMSDFWPPIPMTAMVLGLGSIRCV